MKTDLAWSSVFDAQTLRSVPQNFSMTAINPEWAWGAGTGTGIKVAVIDGGIDAAHPALGGTVAGYVSITEGSVCGSAYYRNRYQGLIPTSRLNPL